MKFLNIHIKPDGSVTTEEHLEHPYFHSQFFPRSSEKLKTPPFKQIDEELPNRDFIHTDTRPDGMHILIVKKVD